MRHSSLLPFTLLLLASTSGWGQSRQDAQWAAIRQLGDLNGVALHCAARAETRRMKQALIRWLPRRRQLGELFDLQSNQAYLDFIKQQSRCPAGADLHAQVSAAIGALATAYADE
jgi:hypothetical protein